MFIVKKNTGVITATLAIAISGIAAILGWTYLAQQTSAADMSKFDPGNIMSDAVMSNKDSMSVQQIQAFLNSKNACNNTNTYMASWYPHLQYTIRDGKFVCMAQDTFNGKSAAQIIWQVGQDYGINPQFLIVLLEKEQGLVTDTWPNQVQYRSATGFGCPDTAACDSKYFGLENQLVNAANLFRTVLNGGWSNYPVGQTYVQYHPNTSCGGSIVNIKNRATSALYRYTPYQPNQSALNAGYGTGDSCGAYGNRNTWAFFSDWFGDPTDNGMVPLDDPRWMVLKKDTHKKGLYTNEQIGPTLQAGRQMKFLDKVQINDKWLLRTEWDKQNNNLDGILLDDLEEIKAEAITPVWKTVNQKTAKVDPLRDTYYEKVDSRTSLKLVDKISVNSKVYYRTEYEQSAKRTRMIPENALNDYSLSALGQPRYMQLDNNVRATDPITGQTSALFTKGDMLFFNYRTTINGALYLQPEQLNNTNFMIESSNLNDISAKTPSVVPLDDPRWLSLKVNTSKISMTNGYRIGPTLQAGRQIKFLDKVRINDKWLLRTEWDKQNNNLDGILLDDLEEITHESMQPQTIALKNDTQKINPVNGKSYEVVKKSEYPAVKVVDRITVGSKVYYRTEYESLSNRYRFISGDDLVL